MRRVRIAAILNLSEDSEKLYPITNGRIIASLPFGCRYRLIDFPFSSLNDAGITSCALFISGNGQSLYDHIRDGYVWGLDSSIGGGVFIHSKDLDESYYNHQMNYCLRSKATHVLVMGSKMLCNLDLNECIEKHLRTNADVTVVYKKENHDFGYHVELNQDVVTSLSEVHCVNEVNLSLNIALFKTEKFIDYVKMAEQGGLKDDVNLLIQFALKNQDVVIGYEYKGYLKVINQIKDYYEANMELLNKTHYDALFNGTHKIITRPKNGAPTYFSSKSHVSNSQLASDCYIEGQVFDSIVFRKVKIGKEAIVSHSIIMHQCQIGEGAILDYVILDKEVKVNPGVILRGTKEHPLVIEKNSVVKYGIEVK